MHPLVWLAVSLLLVGAVGSLWTGFKANGPPHRLKRPEILVGILGLLAGSAKIVEAYWSAAAGLALMGAAAAVSVLLIARLLASPGVKTDA